MTDTVDLEATTSPGWGDVPLPRRNGPRTLLPLSWLGRSVRLEYETGNELHSTNAVLLDFCGHGPCFSLDGEKVVMHWDCLRLLTLIEGD